MKNSNKFQIRNPLNSNTKIVGAIIVVIFLFSIGFISGYQTREDDSFSNASDRKEIPQEEVAHKIYENTRYHYYIDYPTDWDAAETSDGESVFFYHSNKAAHNPLDESHVSVVAVSNPAKKKLHEWLAERKPLGQYTEEQIIIHGKEGMKVSYSAIKGMESIYLPYSDIVFEATFLIHENSQEQLDLWKNYFENILMSLRFATN